MALIEIGKNHDEDIEKLQKRIKKLEGDDSKATIKLLVSGVEQEATLKDLKNLVARLKRKKMQKKEKNQVQKRKNQKMIFILI